MKLFIVFSFLLALSLLTMAKTVSPKKSIMKQNLSSKIAVEVKVKEEKKVFETLIIQFLSFGHEHSSSGPDEAFSATTGVYSFKLSLRKTTRLFPDPSHVARGRRAPS